MGASTGRDGIGGASVLASAELEEGDDAKRPTRPDRRPVRGVEAARVLPRAARRRAAGLAAGPRRRRADLLGRRDGLGRRGRDRHRRRQGAAARGRHGAVRDHGLRVAGADAGRRRARSGSTTVLAVCERWQTGAAAIGEVTDDGRLRVLRGGEVVGEMPVAALVDGCPLYDLEPAEPRGLDLRQRRRARPATRSAAEILLALLASPNVACKRWAFEQYDSVVGSRTVRRPEGADAAVLQIPEAGDAIAVSIDGNGRRVACDPYAGTIEAVLECAQNLACVGAEPLGLTNCLNFGNPEKPAVAWQLDRAVERARRRLRGARRPGRRRQRLALQREPARARSTRRRWSAWSASCPTRARAGGSAFAARRRRDRARRPVRTLARRARSWRSCAASSARACPAVDVDAVAAALAARPRGGARRRRLAPPTTSATAASPARSPRWRSPAASAAEVDLDPLRRAAAARARRPCSARARAASCSAASAALEALATTGSTCWRSARSAASVEIAAGDRSRRRWPRRGGGCGAAGVGERLGRHSRRSPRSTRCAGLLGFEQVDRLLGAVEKDPAVVRVGDLDLGAGRGGRRSRRGRLGRSRRARRRSDPSSSPPHPASGE